ncbi:hypothetical protein BC937DRAFT_92046, partial [Endogone sp. FLAS-F59071]
TTLLVGTGVAIAGEAVKSTGSGVARFVGGVNETILGWTNTQPKPVETEVIETEVIKERVVEERVDVAAPGDVVVGYGSGITTTEIKQEVPIDTTEIETETEIITTETEIVEDNVTGTTKAPAKGPGFFGRVTAAAKAAGSSVAHGVQSVGNVAADATLLVGGGVTVFAVAAAESAIDGAKRVGEGVVSVGSEVVDVTTAVGTGVVEGAKNVGTNVAEGTKYVAVGVVDIAKGGAQVVGTGITTVTTDVVGGAKYLGTGMIDGTTTVVSAVGSASSAVGNATTTGVEAISAVAALAGTALLLDTDKEPKQVVGGVEIVQVDQVDTKAIDQSQVVVEQPGVENIFIEEYQTVELLAVPINLGSVKAYVFDIFALVDWRTTVTLELQSLAARTTKDSLSSIDWALFATKWYDGFVTKVAELSLTGEFRNSDALFFEVLLRLVSEFDIVNTTEELRELNLVWHRLNLHTDSALSIRALKKEYITTTLSNASFRTLVDLARHCSVCWNANISAELFQTYNAEKVYTSAAALLGLEPQEIAVVSSSRSALLAARGAGFATAYVCRTVIEEEAFETDLVVGSVAQLAQSVSAYLEEDRRTKITETMVTTTYSKPVHKCTVATLAGTSLLLDTDHVSFRCVFDEDLVRVPLYLSRTDRRFNGKEFAVTVEDQGTKGAIDVAVVAAAQSDRRALITGDTNYFLSIPNAYGIVVLWGGTMGKRRFSRLHSREKADAVGVLFKDHMQELEKVYTTSSRVLAFWSEAKGEDGITRTTWELRQPKEEEMTSFVLKYMNRQ